MQWPELERRHSLELKAVMVACTMGDAITNATSKEDIKKDLEEISFSSDWSTELLDYRKKRKNEEP